MAVPVMPAVEIVEFARLASTRPYAAGLDWGDLAARLTTFAERDQKDGPGWSPAVYESGTTRGNENVAALTAAVIDIDHSEPDWPLLNAFEYVAHTTYSHMAEGDDPHWRVVIPFSQPVKRDDWGRTWRKIQFWLAPSADEACKDESRFYWWPTCKPGAPREVRHHQGQFLDPDTLRDLPDQQPPMLHIVDRPVGEPDASGERPGDRFTRETDWADILRGWKLLTARGPERRWERPENGVLKKTPGCSATTGGGGHDVLYVFSSNAQPFDPNTSYTKFRAYSVLEHGGDNTAAAAALAERYREDAEEPTVDFAETDWLRPPSVVTPGMVPQMVSEPPPVPAMFFRPISELLAMPEVEPDWMVDQLFTVGSNGWVAAEPKVGKSWVVLELAYALSTGMPFLGRFSIKQPRRVLYVQEEDSLQRVLRRLKKIIKGDRSRPTPSDEFWRWSIRSGFKLDSLTWLEMLRQEIISFKAEVIILDVFNRLHGSDENKQAEMTAILNNLTRLTNDYGCAFIIVHHNRKSQQGDESRANQKIRGSGVLAGWSECSLYLRRSKEKDSIIVTPESKDAPEMDDFMVQLQDQDNGGIFLQVGEVEQEARLSRGDADALSAVRMVSAGGVGATVQAIAKELDKDRTTVQKRLTRLVEAGYLTSYPISDAPKATQIYEVEEQ
jgi:hypothetical protein